MIKDNKNYQALQDDIDKAIRILKKMKDNPYSKINLISTYSLMGFVYGIQNEIKKNLGHKLPTDY